MRRNWKLESAMLLTAVSLAACGGGGDAEGSGEAAGGGEEEAATTTTAPAGPVGTISGTVSFTGDAPAMTSVDMSEVAECQDAYGADGPVSQNVLVSNGGLANVLVSVDFEGAAPEPSGDAPVLDQIACRYTPHVMGLQAGQSVRVTTQDAFLHNVNMSRAVNNRLPNFGLPRAGMSRNVEVSAAEPPFPVQCDVHGWMTAYIGVFDHPYFAVSGADGSFSIPNVPAGEYSMTAWHEEYGTMSGTVTVTEGGTAEVSFNYGGETAGADVPLGEPLVLDRDVTELRFTRGQ